jgi:hypothetical protein
MAREIPEEELQALRADANLRERIRRLFSQDTGVRADAVDALKEAWDFDDPSFNMGELATMDYHASTLAAMRRDSIKEVITWLTRI